MDDCEQRPLYSLEPGVIGQATGGIITIHTYSVLYTDTQADMQTHPGAAAQQPWPYHYSKLYFCQRAMAEDFQYRLQIINYLFISLKSLCVTV